MFRPATASPTRKSSLFDNDLIHYALLILPRESIREYRNPLIALDVDALQLAIRREHHVVGVGFTQENGQVAFRHLLARRLIIRRELHEGTTLSCKLRA